MLDLTLEEAAERLGLAPEQLRERASNGEIPSAILDADGWSFASQSIDALARWSRGNQPRGSRGVRP